MTPKRKIAIRLSDDRRHILRRHLTAGAHASRLLVPARIPLKADAGGPDAGSDEEIAERLETSRMTVQRARRQFAAEGLGATLHREQPTGRAFRKRDGEREAQLVALACSTAPEGHARWTMALRADRSVEMNVVGSIDPAAVWRTPKKTRSGRGRNNGG